MKLSKCDADLLMALEARLRDRLARVEQAGCFCAAVPGVCGVHSEADEMADLLDELHQQIAAAEIVSSLPGRPSAEGAD